MSGYILRQSTATQYCTLGPIVDSTAYAAYTTAIPNTELKLTKYGSTSAVNKNSGGSTPITGAPGSHGITFDATDTNTIGEMQVAVTTSGVAPYAKCFRVVTAAVYDALYASAAAGFMPASPTGAVPALGILDAGTLQSGSTAAAAKLRSGVSFADNFLNGQTAIYLSEGTGAGQTRTGKSWNNTSKLLGVTPDFTVTPDDTTKYILYSVAPAITDTNFLQLVRAVDSSGNAIATAALQTTTKTVVDSIAAKTTNLPDNMSTTLNTIVTKTNNIPGTPAAVGDIPTPTVIAAAVLDKQLSAHLTSGSAGAALNAASSSGDPWATILPGAYGTNTAGNIIGNRVDAPISSRLAASSYTVAPSTSQMLTALKADAEWKIVVANANGDWTINYPATMPGVGTLTLKDITGATTLATYGLTFDSGGRITQRNVT